MWEEKAVIDGPYHFDLALERLARDPLNIVDKEKRLIRVPIYKEKPEVADVQAVGTTEQPAFMIRGSNIQTKQQVMDRIASIFQWNLPLVEIHRHFSTTALNDIFEIHFGTPIVLEFSLYPALIRPIIHQQVNMSFAISLTEQFVKTFGFEIEGVPFFPMPETAAKMNAGELRNLRFSQRKAEYIIDLSKMIASGELDLAELAEKPDEEVVKELVKIRGIGPWTAQSFLLFGLGRKNLFPMADIGLQNAIKKLYQLDRKPTYEEMENYSKDWHPYLSYASFYLWRSIE
ncbi:DNA-3-methyladenine glycosylase [Siminovitchia fortis]|uniref:DNA-3-methyladenine glycosylase II n=1 Tax=Siminovitchia fortis TaxID=254758 RepID=A0A443IU44_9BACI|nr:DNA-3-methyladenine glycosylase [Siminovitchia fortis]RWR11212.1 DNA-3-methyladenine glycosylase 2 family protein [Siminovitchia fortis]WHY80372.1 DNA-3-methyladenine glycosylase [Siminovitchia fortis]